jgi:hypothetical protein
MKSARKTAPPAVQAGDAVDTVSFQLFGCAAFLHRASGYG